MPYSLPISPLEPRPGDMVGPYRVEGPLGEGGMGAVFRATDADGDPVALKLLRPELATDPTYRRRFQREARLAASIVEPHLVPVRGSGTHQGSLYLATAYVPGGSLDERLDEERRLPLADTVSIALQVAAGLSALHGRGLVHRDVKPANILLGDGGRAYLADFGVAKDKAASVLTRTGVAIGSAPYMAPEQIRAEDVTAATDVYALGCVVYECIAGRRPFAGRRGAQLLWAHCHEAPSDPCEDRADAGPELGWAVLRALEKDPAKRPPTATAFARMVQVAARRARFSRPTDPAP